MLDLIIALPGIEPTPYTPENWYMEPKNHPIDKKIIFQLSSFGFHVNFQGCKERQRGNYELHMEDASGMTPFWERAQFWIITQ